MRPSTKSFADGLLRLASVFTTFLLLINLFGNSATGAAIGSKGISAKNLFERGLCPSIQTIVDTLRQRGAGDNTIFYTNPATSQNARALSTTLIPRGNYYGSLVTPDDFNTWMDACGFTPAEQDKLVPRISAAIATAASGTAYILISATQDPRAGTSIWVRCEFPTLMRNGAVTSIRRVDPNDISKPPIEIWRTGDPVDLPACVI